MAITCQTVNRHVGLLWAMEIKIFSRQLSASPVSVYILSALYLYKRFYILDSPSPDRYVIKSFVQKMNDEISKDST